MRGLTYPLRFKCNLQGPQVPIPIQEPSQIIYYLGTWTLRVLYLKLRSFWGELAAPVILNSYSKHVLNQPDTLVEHFARLNVGWPIVVGGLGGRSLLCVFAVPERRV